MTMARESEEVREVEEGKATNIVSDWDSPDLEVDLVDQIWDMVKSWLTDREPAASDFFCYCRNLCYNIEEADEVWVWMLNLIAHFVAEDESFLDSVHTAKDWRELALVSVDNWEVPPPLWLVRREEELKKKHEEEEKLKELKEEKENEEAEESLVTTSPVDLDQNDSGGSYVEPLAEGEVESSVSYCNLKKTSLHPQLTISSTTTMTSHQLTSPPTCQFCSQRAEQL